MKKIMKETILKGKSDPTFFEYLGESMIIAWIVQKLSDEGVEFRHIKKIIEELKSFQSLEEKTSISDFVKEIAEKYNI